MELSKGQELLLGLLKNTEEMDENLIIATMLLVKEPEKTDKLLDYIVEMWDKNQELDKDKIVKKIEHVF